MFGFAGSPLAFRGRWLFASAATAAIVGAAAWWLISSSSPYAIETPRDEGPPLFEEMTAQSGLHQTYRNGQETRQFAIIESLGGGVALFDYDGDCLLDVFIPGGGYFEVEDEKSEEPKVVDGKVGKAKGKITAIKGYPCKLYKNLGNWKFRDVTTEVGLDKIDFFTHGCAVGDYNRDGWPDLLVTGWGRVALFKNVSGTGGRREFTDVTAAAGLTGKDWWTTSAAWADLNGDGYPDLYICQYVDWSPANNPDCPGYYGGIPNDVCPPRNFKGRDHLLFRNNGDGTFTNATREAGLNVRGLKVLRGEKLKDVEVGKGLGVLIVDLDNDGRPDIYVANDTVEKLLYMNRSRRRFFPRGIRLEEVAWRRNVAVDGWGQTNGSMGLAAADFNGTGFASLFVTNYEDEMHSLYWNHGKENFTFETENMKIMAIGQTFVGWGTSFVDLENRGWEDIVITDGHVIRYPLRAPRNQKPVLFHNEEGQRFDVITPRGGPYFRTEHCGRGLAVGDLDNDGRPDLVISHVNDPVAVLRNVAGESGTRNHWLGLELVGRGFRDIVGSRVIVEAGGRRRAKFVIGGGSYASASDPRLLFGLASLTKVERVTVVWSWGKTEVFEGGQFQNDRYWLLKEGTGKAEKWLPRIERR